jgi:hypothetical protein
MLSPLSWRQSRRSSIVVAARVLCGRFRAGAGARAGRIREKMEGGVYPGRGNNGGGYVWWYISISTLQRRFRVYWTANEVKLMKNTETWIGEFDKSTRGGKSGKATGNRLQDSRGRFTSQKKLENERASASRIEELKARVRKGDGLSKSELLELLGWPR